MKGTYGERLASALVMASKERKDLADELDVSVQAIGQVILGSTKSLTAENHEKAARFLCVNGYWLATGEEDPHLIKRDWPFPLISPERYELLKPKQKEAVEDWIDDQITKYSGIPTDEKSRPTKKKA